MESNEELQEYLIRLFEQLQEKTPDIAQELLTASRFATGSPSEFFHEAFSALQRVREGASTVLTQKETFDLACVISQIETAFNKIGGA